MLKLKDNQWVSIGNVAITVLNINKTLSGRLSRILPIVADKTLKIRTQFQSEIQEAIKEEGDSADIAEIEKRVSESFSKGETEIDLPELKAEWFDDVVFLQGHYQFFTPLFT